VPKPGAIAAHHVHLLFLLALRLPQRLRGSLLALALLIGFPAGDLAHAARNLPKDARYGRLAEFAHPYAKIGGKVLHMSPGAKIYNQQNLIILPAAMRAPANVLYRLDTSGELAGIWILTAQEAAAYERGPFKPKPASAPPSAGPAPPAQAPADARLGGRQ